MQLEASLAVAQNAMGDAQAKSAAFLDATKEAAGQAAVKARESAQAAAAEEAAGRYGTLEKQVWAAAKARDEAERQLSSLREVARALREAAAQVEEQRREEATEMGRVVKRQREKQQASRAADAPEMHTAAACYT